MANFLYGDSAYIEFLVGFSQIQHAFEISPQRGVAYIFVLVIPWLIYKLTQNYSWIQPSLEIMYFYVPFILGASLCLRSIRKGAALNRFAMLSIFFLFLIPLLGFTTETIWTLLFAMFAINLLQSSNPFKASTLIALSILMTCLSFTHELMLFVWPVVLLAARHKLSRQYFTIFSILAVFCILLHFSLFLFVTTQQSESHLTAMNAGQLFSWSNLKKAPTVLFPLLLFVAHFPISNKIVRFFVVGISVVLVGGWVFSFQNQWPWSWEHRSVLIYGIPLLALFAARPSAPLSKISILILISTASINVGHFIRQSKSVMKYNHQLQLEMRQNKDSGSISILNSGKFLFLDDPEYFRFFWGWTLPFESINSQLRDEKLPIFAFYFPGQLGFVSCEQGFYILKNLPLNIDPILMSRGQCKPL